MKLFYKIVLIKTLLLVISFSASAEVLIKDLYFQHKENASTKWFHYFDIYQSNFKEFVKKKPNVLEIGIQNGGSLQIFKKFFKNANLYGIDIDKKVCEQNLGKNIITLCIDIKDTQSFNKHLKDLRFNIIIDDGSHMQEDIIFAFEYLFDKLEPGGVYLIEDLHTSYWPKYQGGYRKKTTSIEYFKSLVDYINYNHMKDQDVKLLSSEFIKRYTPWIDNIIFYDGVVVIRKSLKSKNKRFDNIVVGTKQPVFPSIDIAKKYGFYIDQIKHRK